MSVSASSGSCSATTTRSRGRVRRSSGSNGMSERRMAVANPATRTVPVGSASASRSRRAASTAARIVTPWSASRRPAGVSRTCLPTGSSSVLPVSAASAASCWHTVDVVMPSSSATARIEPSRASATRSSSLRVSIQ